jgi:glycosyltransferase involved in cell wall biosynthesis
MCLIAKNEREHVEPCLTSFGADVDEIVFCDTGSRDGTVAEVRRVCREREWTDKLVLGRFQWTGSFADARNHAESRASGEFVCTTDLDETIVGAASLRRCCDYLTPDVGSMTGANILVADAYYCGRWGWRQRLARRGAFPWVGRCADRRQVRGGIGSIGRDVCHWVHLRQWEERDADRYVRVAERWTSAEPSNPEATFELAYELGDAGRGEEAAAVLGAFVAEYPERKSQLEALVREIPSLTELWSYGPSGASLRQGLRSRLCGLTLC